MKGFVLAAGFGQRLRPVTEVIPKPLLPVGNLPLIGYALKLLAHHGITDVIVNVHHLSKALVDAVGSGERFGVNITYSIEDDILGTGGALRRMRSELEDGPFVVVNSDTIVDVDLQAVLESHRSRGALATMVLREDPKKESFGQIEIDGAGRIRRILGNGQPKDGLRSLMFTGIHVLEPRFLEYIPPDINTCIVRYAYTKALNNDEKLHAFVSDGFWADAGTPERYFAVNEAALNRGITLSHADPLGGYALSPKRDVAEVVRMGDKVDIGVDVRIVPPVVLGDRVKIGDHATVGPYAVVGARANIGRDANVTHSIITEGARVDGGAVISRRLVAKKCHLEI